MTSDRDVDADTILAVRDVSVELPPGSERRHALHRVSLDLARGLSLIHI